MQGETFGNYEVGELLGKGGMGEVYRARDTRLGRDVAIKVLPADLTADAERLARFEREARVLASLNHPNISAVYGLEQVNERQCLILELAEGYDLSERIARGPLPVDEAIEIASQIALGVQAAHDKNVIHRDIKPTNIKIGPEGVVKILDFGLAKAISGQAESADSSLPPLGDSPTLTHQMTSQGMLLGTAGYMSPEQAKGQAVDARTDVWAFGCVLYEMLTGGPTFSGETATDVIAAVVTRAPDWDRLPEGLPSPLRRLLRRCFVKDRHQRLQHIGDARLELQDARDAGPEGDGIDRAPDAAKLRGVGVTTVVLAVLAAAAVGALGMWALGRSEAQAPPQRRVFSINLEHPLQSGGLTARPFDISADGSMLVYAGNIGPQASLYLRRMNDLEVRPIPGTEGAGDPIFSPDGRWVLYTARGQLYKVSIGGGKPVLLCNAPGVPYGIDWSPEGTIVMATNLSAGFYKLSDEGDAFEVIPVGDGAGLFRWPVILPGGKFMLGALNATDGGEGARQIVAVDIDTGQIKTLMPGTSPHYLRSGHLLYKRGSTMLAVPFDPRRLETTGSAIALPYEVGEWIGRAWLATSDSGDLIYATEEPRSANQLVWVDRDGHSQPVIAQRGEYYAPRVSPNGERLTWTSSISHIGDIWVHDIGREFSTRITKEGFDAYPTWHPDSEQIVFMTDKSNIFELYAKPADRTGGEIRLAQTPNIDVPVSVARDGSVFFYQVSADTQRDVFVLKPDGAVEALVVGRHNERGPSVSPDGKWFAYVSDETGNDEIYAQPYPTTGQRWRVSSEGGAEPRWAPDGSAIYFRNGESLMEARVSLTPEFSPAAPVELFHGPFVLDGWGNPNFDVSPDGKRFLMVEGEPAEPARLKVVVNWLDGLETEGSP